MQPLRIPSYYRLANACSLLLAISLLTPLAANAIAENSTIQSFSRQQLTSVYYSEGTAVGDIDNDGFKDVVYGPYWFSGPSFSVKHEIYAPVAQPTEKYSDHFFAWVYDFDNDGNSDVFTVGFPGTPAHVYKNPGLKGVSNESKNQHWTKTQVFNWVSNESPQLVNLVGDNTPELVCTREGFFGYASVDPAKPFSAWKFHPISEKVTDERFGHGLGVGDINGDGRKDLIHAKGWFEQPADKAENVRWKSHSAAFTNSYGGAEMYAYDVDGDGDNDVITSEAAHDFGLSWYEQTKSADGIEFKRHRIMGSQSTDNEFGVVFSELHSVNLADIDGDGLKDIVTGKTYYSHHKQSPMWDAGPVVYWFRLVRGPNGVEWHPYQIDNQSGIGRQVITHDMNSDGLLDVITGGMRGSHVLSQSKGKLVKPMLVDGQPLKKAESTAIQKTDSNSTTFGKHLRGARIPFDSASRTVANVIEGELLKPLTTGGTALPQPMGGFKLDQWSGDSHLWWTGAKPGDTLSFELETEKALEAIEMAFTCARDYGIATLTIDDKPLSEAIDFFETEVVSTGLLRFNTNNLPAGKHKLEVKIVGANAKAAKSYMFGLDFLRLRYAGDAVPIVSDGIRATAADGRPLNLDFESGTLDDWTAKGDAFDGQPIKGDTVSARRGDMRSGHHGDYWIGTYEKGKDAGQGTLTSIPFTASHRFATFWVGGGNVSKARVELIAAGESKPFYQVGGRDTEELSQVVVDLNEFLGKQIQIRLVDESSVGWGHLNFDHFRFSEARPSALTPPSKQLISDEYLHSGLDAAAAAAAMKVPDGFKVTAIASEPDVQQPIAMALDDRGRTWIAEAYEYPQRAKGDKGRDRILIFEDTNGDGKLDSRKVFAEGLNLVSGLEVGFGGVWVGAAPYLMFIPDQDGDDKPDSEPKILLDGWGYQDTHETLNAFIWGPDGWLYGCHGVFTHSRVGKPGTPDSDRQPINAGVWRYHPTRHEFEVFAHGTSNPWGVDFNDEGETFITACVIPHLFHMIQGGRYHRQGGEHFNKHTYNDIKTIADHFHYLGATPHSGNGKSDEAGGGHAHAGAMIYLGGAWPKQYHGGLFMNNIHGQRLNVDLLEPRGSGYVGKHAPDFLLTGDLASQILNMRYGPDGQVTMIDWYDMQACHVKEIEKHDRSNGRIYKISYGKTSPVVKVDLKKKSDLELAELCLDPNEWYVRHSRRILQERAFSRKIDKSAVDKLSSIAATHADVPRRLRAIWTKHVIGSLSKYDIDVLSRDSSPVIRGWALRLAAEQSTAQQSTPELVQRIETHAKDKSPVAQLAAASALQRIPLKDRWNGLTSLAAHQNVATDHNLPLMIWYAAEPLSEIDPSRALSWALTAGENVPVLRDYMLRRIAGSGDEEAVQRLLAGLQKTHQPNIQITFIKAIRTALVGQRTAKMPSDWKTLYTTLAESESKEVRLLAAALGVTFQDEGAMNVVRQQVMDASVPTSDRVQSLEALIGAKDKSLVETLLQIIQSASPGNASNNLREVAIRGLAQYDDGRVSEVLLGTYAKLTPNERRTAIATLCSRASSALGLLKAIEAKQIESSDLSADLARQLEYLGSSDVKEMLGKVWGVVQQSSAERTKQIERYKLLVDNTKLAKPDEKLGRNVFAKTCQRCHVLYGVGQKLGPDLTGSNRANLDYLLENIVDPSAVMANEYRQTVFLTTDGQVIAGIVRSETENGVNLQTPDATVVVPKDDIESRVSSEKSMMPDDQLSQFSDHEIRSLIAYLRSKAQVPLE